MADSPIFTKLKSKEAKGICILIMFLHHLFAFPERLDNVFNSNILIRIGQELSLIVGLYVFISGYGLALKPLRLKDGFEKIVNLWLTFSIVFAIFIPIGYYLDVYKFDVQELLENLFFIKSSYNHEWWFFSLYVQLIVITILLSLIKDEKISLVTLCILFVVSVIIKKIDLGTTFLGLRIYLPVFILSYITCKYNLFNKVDGLLSKMLVKNLRIVCYITLAIIIGKKFGNICFISIFFWFLAFSLININDWLSKVFCFFGKHSVNMWLVHTFFCYYYCKELFISLPNPIIAFCLLLAMSLLTSIVIEYIKNRLKCLRIFFS